MSTRGELEKMIENLNMDVDNQHSETDRISKDLQAMCKENARAWEAHQKNSDEMNRQLTALGVAIQGHQRENERQNEMNHQMSDESMRQILHQHTEETLRERQQ